MTGKKLPDSPLRPGAPNYGNARGRQAAEDNEGIEEENSPGISPGSVPAPVENADDAVSEGRDDTLVSGTSDESRGGLSPLRRTNPFKQ
jgi:hypothetical protein